MKYFYSFCLLICCFFGFNTASADIWRKVDNLPNAKAECLFVTNNTIYCIIYGKGVFSSSDSMKTWKNLTYDLKSKYPNKIVCDDKGNVFISYNGNGVFKLEKDSESWTEANSGISNKRLLDLRLGNNAEIFACGWFEGNVYVSKDKAASWSSIGLSDKDVISVIQSKSSTIYAAAQNTGVFQTTDNGKNWSEMGLRQIDYFSFAEGFGSLYLASSGGIYKLESNSWKNISTNMPNDLDIKSFATLKLFGTGKILAGANYNSGVYRSLDNGNSWSKIGALNLSVKSIERIGATTVIATDSGVYYTEYPMENKKIIINYFPEDTITLDWNKSVKYDISVLNEAFKSLDGAKLEIFNPFDNSQIVNDIDSSGYASYKLTIPNNTLNGTYYLKLFASKSDYPLQDTLRIPVKVVHDNRENMFMTVNMSTPEHINRSAEYRFSITVKDAKSNPIKNASIRIEDIIQNDTNLVFTNSDGIASYIRNVPDMAEQGSYYIIFIAKHDNYQDTKRIYKEIIVDFNADIQENYQSQILVTPNPFNEYLNVSSDFVIKQITLINQLGQEMMSKSINSETFSFDTNHLTEGQYFLVLESIDGKIIYKNIIKY